MTKQEIMDYVTETPHNVNKNILGQKLDQYASQSGGGNSVQYVEQTLTEEQQMMARKNMGLYSKETVPAENKLVYDYVYVGWWEVASTDTLAQGGGIGESLYIIDVAGTQYECKGYRDTMSAPMVGVNGQAYLGNFGLVGVVHENSNADCPVCFYHDVSDSMAMNFAVAIDPNFKPSMSTEIRVYRVTDEMVDKYNTIPDEYIPDTIARKTDIAGGSGGGVFVVRAVGYPGSDVEIDKTFDEILTAVNSGAVVVADWYVGDSFDANVRRSFTTVCVTRSYVSFTSIEYDNGMGVRSGSLAYYQLYIPANGTAHIYIDESTLA